MTMRPPQDIQGLALQWMVISDDRDFRRKVMKVGSVS